MSSVFSNKKLAKATARAADAQNAATKQASEAQAKAAMDAARAAADSQRVTAERAKAADTLNEAMSKPIETADVQLAVSEDSPAAGARKRRASFGQGYSTGVSI